MQQDWWLWGCTLFCKIFLASFPKEEKNWSIHIFIGLYLHVQYWGSKWRWLKPAWKLFSVLELSFSKHLAQNHMRSLKKANLPRSNWYAGEEGKRKKPSFCWKERFWLEERNTIINMQAEYHQLKPYTISWALSPAAAHSHPQA